MKNALTEKELRQQYRERTCGCGSSVSKAHECFTGHKDGLTFVAWLAVTFVVWLAEMAVKYSALAWMRRK